MGLDKWNLIPYKRGMTVNEIIELCGGVARIAGQIGKTDSAVAKWRRIGIRDHYWPLLIELSGKKLTVAQIYEANQHVRAPDEASAA